MRRIVLYTFDNGLSAIGKEPNDDFETFDMQEVMNYAEANELRCTAHMFCYTASELAFDYTPDDDD